MGRLAIITLGFVLCTASMTGAAGAAPSGTLTDINCPGAVPKIMSFNEAAGTNDPVKIGEAAHQAAEAYRRCMVDAATGAQEPRYNYDRTRLASFLVVYGRALAAQQKIAEATAAFKEARSEANDVVEWTPSSQVFSTSNKPTGMSADRNSDQRGSRYKPAAVEIRDSALAELAKLAPSSGAPAAAPAATPAPH
jgi:hypothetical protein